MAGKKYRVGVIASGRIAREHGRGWNQCEQTEIVAIADSHPEALADYARDFNVYPGGTPGYLLPSLCIESIPLSARVHDRT